jgi:hypothetical protein
VPFFSIRQISERPRTTWSWSCVFPLRLVLPIFKQESIGSFSEMKRNASEAVVEEGISQIKPHFPFVFLFGIFRRNQQRRNYSLGNKYDIINIVRNVGSRALNQDLFKSLVSLIFKGKLYSNGKGI